MLEVLQAGPFSTIQDQGRVGLGHYGVPRAGVMDLPAMLHANWLVGNAPNAAVLEVAQGVCRLRFHAHTRIALAGGEMRAQLDGQPVWPGWPVAVRAGQQLKLEGMRSGCYAILAVAGGIQVETVLGSASTDLFAAFGGLDGRALQAGDRLPLAEPVQTKERPGLRLPQNNSIIRVLPGPAQQKLGESCWQQFLQQAWTIRSDSSRMATRLHGKPLTCRALSLKSRMVLPGTVQLLPGGEPLVLQADAQATGGYPELAQVVEWDLWKLAQTPTGRQVHFQAVTQQQALELRQAWLHHFQRLQVAMHG